MVNGTAKLVIDLGNSSTRVTTKFGNNSKGIPRSKTVVQRNSYARLGLKADEIMSNPSYSDENSRVFILNEQKFCNGDMCDKECDAFAMRPTATKAKYNTKDTLMAVINAFCSGYEAVAEFTNSDISSVDVDWEVTVLLPADNIAVGGKALADMIRGIGKINFIMPEVSKELKINSIMIYPEGFAAFIAVLYETKGSIRKGYEYLIKKGVSTLVIDIGAGTTDFLIVMDGNVVTTSKFTVNIGGNNVHQLVKDLVKSTKGIQLKDKAAREGCVTGVVMSGAKEYTVIEEIDEAKYNISRQLIAAVAEFFEGQSIPMQSINNVLICGGGAEESENEKVKPISNYVFETIKESSQDVKLVELPEIEKDGEASRMSSRMLNIIGAGILAD